MQSQVTREKFIFKQAFNLTRIIVLYTPTVGTMNILHLIQNSVFDKLCFHRVTVILCFDLEVALPLFSQLVLLLAILDLVILSLLISSRQMLFGLEYFLCLLIRHLLRFNIQKKSSLSFLRYFLKFLLNTCTFKTFLSQTLNNVKFPEFLTI